MHDVMLCQNEALLILITLMKSSLYLSHYKWFYAKSFMGCVQWVSYIWMSHISLLYHSRLTFLPEYLISMILGHLWTHQSKIFIVKLQNLKWNYWIILVALYILHCLKRISTSFYIIFFCLQNDLARRDPLRIDFFYECLIWCLLDLSFVL